MKKTFSKKVAVGFCAMGLLMAGSAWAVPTSLVVRVRAHDAKFVGTGVGDLQVTVRDFTSGDVLASGMVTGGTGNTTVLMKEAKGRDTVLSDGKSASYTAKLDIDAPKKLLVEVDGPLSSGLDMHHDVKTTWLIPGEDITGDGLLFEEYGLIVRNYKPTQHQFIKIGATATIGAHVSPMCGCPVSPGFLWDADKYKVTAVVEKDGKQIASIPMTYAGQISDFEASYTFTKGGTYKITTIAVDDKNNQGVDTTSYVVAPEQKIKVMSGRK